MAKIIKLTNHERLLLKRQGAQIMQVNILEAKNQLSKLIKAAEAGQDVIIANRGVPVARLIPTGHIPTCSNSVTKDSKASIVDWLENNPLPNHARRSQEEIDAMLHEERDAWD
jgi:prevent-host-death family protein